MDTRTKHLIELAQMNGFSKCFVTEALRIFGYDITRKMVMKRNR